MEEKQEPAVPECRKNNDLRTFAIALITAVIVVALYHFGCGLCKIFCSEGCDAAYPAPRYMLVRVMDVPMVPPEEGMHRPGPGRFGMRGKPGFGPRGKGQHGFRGKGQFRKGPRPEAGNPADSKAEAAKPAPAPAAAPAAK